MTHSLRNQKVLIVGGSSGIGLAVGIQACRAGAKVAVASRTAPERHREITAAVGCGIETYAIDVEAGDAIEATLDRVGNFDHLVITTRPALDAAPSLKRTWTRPGRRLKPNSGASAG